MKMVKAVPGRQICLPGIFKKIFLLFLGIFLLLGCAFFFLPFLSHLLGFERAHEIILEEKIEAGAFFYTGVEKIREIEGYMRDSHKYEPVGVERLPRFKP